MIVKIIVNTNNVTITEEEITPSIKDNTNPMIVVKYAAAVAVPRKSALPLNLSCAKYIPRQEIINMENKTNGKNPGLTEATYPIVLSIPEALNSSSV